MSEITLFVPREEMLHQAHDILHTENYNIKDMKVIASADAVSEARSALARGTSIIIARGYQASLIKYYTNIPVVEIKITGQEMGLLITKAKKIIKKSRPVIGVVGFKNLFCDMTHFNQIYNIELRTYLVSNPDELSVAINEAINDNLDIIIGGDNAITAASRVGIPSLFLSSTEESIREAFKMAENMKYAAEIEQRSMAQIETLLDYSFNGIVKMNQSGEILVINKIMEEILGKASAEVEGKPLIEVFKDIDKEKLEETLKEGNGIYSTFIRVNENALVIIIAPIKVEQRIDGAILTCHKVKKMKELEADILRERYLYGYIAQGTLEEIPHKSKCMQKNIALAKVYAQSNSPVLIYGEIGTEKELFAQGIHNNSLRKNGPFISTNCIGMSDEMQTEILFGGTNETETEKQKGALITANHGTILISEIDKLSLSTQYRLYKMIRYKSLIRNDVVRTMSIDVKIIATTSKNLSVLVKQGLFREDLYYLLCGLTIDVEALRNRPEDLDYLIDNYVKIYCDLYSRYHVMTAGAKQRMMEYPWYGNLIQLESFCDRMILGASHRSIDESYITVLLEELYPIAQQLRSGKEKLIIYKDPEAVKISEILEKYDGNRTLAAEELGISKTTLWRHMKKFGISGKYNV